MNYIKILDKMLGKKKFTINEKTTDEELQIVSLFWISIRDNNPGLVEELVKYLKEKGREDFIEQMKKEVLSFNKEYYDFEYFRRDDIDNINKEFLLNTIMKEYIIINKRNLLKLVNKELSEEVINSIALWIKKAVYYSISKNYDGARVVDILVNEYNIDKELLNNIENIYNENIIQLKLNYIIESME